MGSSQVADSLALMYLGDMVIFPISTVTNVANSFASVVADNIVQVLALFGTFLAVTFMTALASNAVRGKLSASGSGFFADGLHFEDEGDYNDYRQNKNRKYTKSDYDRMGMG